MIKNNKGEKTSPDNEISGATGNLLHEESNAIRREQDRLAPTIIGLH